MSQYGEHVKILEYFGTRQGRFLDIGAGSGDELSNTVPLIERGWEGVLVEPALHQLEHLIKSHADNPKIEIIPAAIRTTAPGTFWEAGDYSTLSPLHKAVITSHSEGRVIFRQRAVVQLSVMELFELVPDSYDFVNIDVEGNNLAVLESVLCGMQLSPGMVCVEMDPIKDVEAMSRALSEAGLTHQRPFVGNLLAWRGWRV